MDGFSRPRPHQRGNQVAFRVKWPDLASPEWLTWHDVDGKRAAKPETPKNRVDESYTQTIILIGCFQKFVVIPVIHYE